MKKSKVLQHLSRWALVIVPTVLGLALILSTGPQIQSYLISLLNSDVPSVYGSAYQESLANFPRLSAWVGAGFEWGVLLMALLITLAVVQRSDAKLVAWRAALASILVLCTFDIGLGLFQQQLTLKWVVENAAGNVLGGIFLTAVLVIIFSIADFLYSHAPVSNAGKRVVAAGSVLVGGLVLCCLVYYLVDFFYNPLPVKFDAYFAAPASGTVAAKPTTPTLAFRGRDEVRPFSFVPSKEIKGNVIWTGVEGALKVKLLTRDSRPMDHVSIALLSGCSTWDEVKVLNDIAPWLAVDNVDALEVSFDTGPSSFFTMFSEAQTSRFKVDAGVVGNFNIDQDAQSKHLKVTQVVGEDASLEVDSSANEQSFFLSAPVLRLIHGKPSLSSRILNLKVDARTYFLKFDPPKNARSADKVVCSENQDMQRKPAGDSDFISVGPVDIMTGVVVKVRRKDAALMVNDMNVALRVSGGGGWLSLVGLQPKQLENHSLGALQMFQVRGNITDIVLDGSPATTRPLDTYTAMGDLQAAYGDQGKLHVAGRVKSLWKDQSRMNPTKWEKLEWEAKVFMLGLLGSLLAFFGRVLAKRLRGNSRFTWMD
jgi:hypothetical protein